MRRTSTGCILTLLIFAASAVQAATIIPPRDLAQLARSSETVVLAQAGVSRGELRAGIPFTVTEFQLLEVVAGAAPSELFEVQEPGGHADGLIAVVPGSPRYTVGGEYLLFLARNGERLSTRLLSWGVFERRVDALGQRQLVPIEQVHDLAAISRGPVEPLRPMAETELLQRLHSGAAHPAADAVLERLDGHAPGAASTTDDGGSASSATAACRYLTDGDGQAARWFRFADGVTAPVAATNPASTLDEEVVQAAVRTWNEHPQSEIRFEYAGTVATAACSGGSQPGSVLFGDPCDFLDDMVDCTGILAWGGPLYGSEVLEFAGEPWHDVHDFFVVVNEGARCIGDQDFAEVVTHELGHGLGFGHHEDPEAVMYYACCRGIGSNLAAIDEACAASTYAVAEPVVVEPPTDVTAAVVSPTEVQLTWRPAGGAEAFLVERNLGYGWVELARAGGEATSFVDRQAPPCSSTSYRIAAVAGASVSAFSPSASAITGGEPPAAPARVTAVLAPTGAHLTWELTLAGVANIEIERALAGETFTRLAVLDGVATSYHDEAGSLGDRYRVSARNGCGLSPSVEARLSREPGAMFGR